MAQMILTESTAPSTPASGTLSVYAKTDHSLYMKTSAGVESVIGGVPAGTIIDFGGSAAPTGYLACNGAAVSRTTYATLFTAIGTLWGTGDGSTTFNVPNFTAGYASVQTAGTVGAATTGTVKAHTHNIVGAGAASGSFGYTVGSSTGVASGSTGGSDNLAAGMAVFKCIKT